MAMFSVASETRITHTGMSRGQIDARCVVMATAARQRAEVGVCYTHTGKNTRLQRVQLSCPVFSLNVIAYTLCLKKKRQ